MTDEGYFEELESRLEEAIELADEARKKGGDPTPEVEIPVAKDLADRVENLIGVEGVAERIRALEDEEDSREEVALRLAEEFANGAFPPETRDEKAEAAIRTAVALLTEGVVAAPIEGIDGVDLLTNDDGSEYLRVEYAGPIRSAGGTAQALSVLVADYVGSSLGVDAYKPRDDEVERYVEEVNLYDEEVGLQYTPKNKETRLIVENCPVCLDGEPTTEREVSGYRDLERINTNRGRGGMCLVAAEGIALKAPKIKKHVEALGMDGWDWIDELMHSSSGSSSGGDEDGDDKETNVEPNEKYLEDLTAGRPIFSHPSRPGGFRLRYARARNTGLAAAGVSPATMVLFDDFLAAGTQVKTERPGKAAGIAPVDGIEGPTVVLSNGEVRRVDTEEEARRVRNGVERIVDVGEIALNYGEFLENNHPLVPGSYTHEWWIRELEDSEADVDGMRQAFDLEVLGARQAFRLARKYGVPLHPRYTYLWHDIDRDGYDALVDALRDRSDDELVFDLEGAEVLEKLLVPHTQEEVARVKGDHAHVLHECLNTDVSSDLEPLQAASQAAGVELRERAPTRIGARMGRPEKSKKREMNPAVHCLFPIGDAGGSQRDIDEAASHAESMKDTVGEISVSAGVRRCPSCGEETYEAVCDCGSRTEPVERCPSCEIEVKDEEECPRCGGETTTVRRFDVRIDEEYQEALENVGERPSYDILKCVKGLTSENKTPEPLEKGVLRAKHGVSTFKDGTVRYDMTDLPLTSFRPDEIDVSVERLREMGYEEDIEGEKLRDPEQVVELKPQDVVLSRDSAEHLKRVADFVDDLLVKYYGVEPYHEVEGADDTVGELVMGLAPHTSAGVLGRVVGFTDASVGYAHPFFHAAKRRNCFHPETKLHFVDSDGRVRHERIESFFEEQLNDASEDSVKRDDFGAVVAELDETADVRVPSLTDDGEMTTAPVEAVSKHPAPEHLVDIRTRNGRGVVVTSDHELQVYNGVEGVKTKRASELSEDDKLITPRELPVEPSQGVESVDLLEEFVASESVENDRLMVKEVGKERLYSIFEDALSDGNDFDVLVDSAEYLGIPKKSLSSYVYRDSVPVSLLLEVLGSRETILEVVPDDVSLGVKRDTTTVDRYVELNENVATLVGYYTAEGFTRKQETSKGTIHQTTFSGTEEEARDFYVGTLRKEFGVKPYRENHAKVTVSGSLFRLVFDEILDAGSGAIKKQVPQQVFNAPRSVAEAYLSGYFSGDGSVERGRLVVNATTVSEELKRDLIALLSRLGVKSRTKEVEPVPLLEQFPDSYSGDDESESATRYVLTVSSEDAVRFHETIGFHLSRKAEVLDTAVNGTAVSGRRVFDGGGPPDAFVEEVESVEYVRSDTEHVYCLTVKDTHSLVVNDLASKQCDGDEDCVTLMSDALLNFSREYLPDQRGGRMDAPLVMTSRIDPTEIDDEAHNVEKVSRYPLSFYEAAREYAHPKDVDVRIAEDDLGTPDAFDGFAHTVETTRIDAGPENSAYKILPSMDEKTTAQLEIGRKTRAVDESDVAERVVESHFLPDLIGNLRAFTQQEFRCLDCNKKFRRPPLSGGCECGGEVTLTVHKGSVKKYLEVALETGEKYGVSDYTMQRLEQLQRQIDSLFEDDKSRQSGIADFM